MFVAGAILRKVFFVLGNTACMFRDDKGAIANDEFRVLSKLFHLPLFFTLKFTLNRSSCVFRTVPKAARHISIKLSFLMASREWKKCLISCALINIPFYLTNARAWTWLICVQPSSNRWINICYPKHEFKDYHRPERSRISFFPIHKLLSLVLIDFSPNIDNNFSLAAAAVHIWNERKRTSEIRNT